MYVFNGVFCRPPTLLVFLAELRVALASLNKRGILMDTLSMGMSNDFEAAIAEGATMIRIGTAIFGSRPDSRVRTRKS